MTARLSVHELRVTYDRGAPAVYDYSVDLYAGSVTVMLGRNGAGKTSTLKGIIGFLPHESGESTGRVSLDGSVQRRRDPLRFSRLGVGLVDERDKVFTNLTVDTQLRMIADTPGDLSEVLDFFPRLAERWRVRAGLLSGGERQMLATALVLLRRPQVLLVDELSLGLAPGVAHELMAYLRKLADSRGTAILAADQAVTAALGIADAVQVMDSGHLVSVGSPSDIELAGLLDTYLGRHER
ncbi:MAG: ATP-binding cassette domain-containing protein [Nocardioidaceae bacterium]